VTEPSLNERTGWPAELRILLERYPREVWSGHANLGQTAGFWLRRHDMFRELGASLQGATSALKEGTVAPAEFRGWFVPRLQFFLTELNAHHHVEDHSYFPLFRAAEPRLVRGFEVLEGDHEHIHEHLGEVAGAANQLLASLDADGLQRTVHHYAGVSKALLVGLLNHLRDEEDLIIPLILDRTEEKLGL
jgi:iron-sulfur cluster repair protein YtfE (RIC family)